MGSDGEQERENREDETGKTNRRLRDHVKQLVTELTLSDWLMVVLTAVIAGSTVWNTVYVGGQLEEMRSSGQDTKNLVIATQHLADRAREQAGSMDRQARNMEKLRLAGELQAKATGDLKDITKAQAGAIAGLYGAIKSSAEASNKTAGAAIAQSQATKAEAESVRGQTSAVQQSLVATRDMASATRDAAKASAEGNSIANRAFLAAERPWVGVENTQADTGLAADTEMSISVTIKNTGRSPALTVHGLFFVRILPPNGIIPDRDECVGCSAATVLPNGEWTYFPKVPKDVLTAAEVDKVKAKTDLVVLFGRLDYRDDGGISHKTLYCGIYNVDHPPGFYACSHGNDAD